MTTETYKNKFSGEYWHDYIKALKPSEAVIVYRSTGKEPFNVGRNKAKKAWKEVGHLFQGKIKRAKFIENFTKGQAKAKTLDSPPVSVTETNG